MEEKDELITTEIDASKTTDLEPMPIEEIKKQISFIKFGAKKESNKSVPVVQDNTSVPARNTEAIKLVDEMHKQAMIATVQNNEDVQERIIDQAGKTIDTELKSLAQENEKRLQETTYDANKEACGNYGINSNVPIWQIRLMKLGSAFWFCIYWIVATIVICPINVFCKGLKAFIKQSWLVILVGVILYLILAIGVPLIIAWLRQDPTITNIIIK